MTMGYLWIAVVFVGAFVLMGAMLWGRRSNQRNSTPSQDRRTEKATKRLYEDGPNAD